MHDNCKKCEVEDRLNKIESRLDLTANRIIRLENQAGIQIIETRNKYQEFEEIINLAEHQIHQHTTFLEGDLNDIKKGYHQAIYVVRMLFCSRKNT